MGSLCLLKMVAYRLAGASLILHKKLTALNVSAVTLNAQDGTELPLLGE